MRALFALILLALFAAPAHAHEIRPAYLEIAETAPQSFDIVWKTPAVQGGALAVSPELAANCTEATDRRSELAEGALITRWRVNCPDGLGESVRIAGLERTLTSAFVRVSWRDGRTAEGLVDGDDPYLAFARTRAVGAYLGLGVEHILSGLDHLGFVAALLLIVIGFRRLLLTLTAFTLAHSLTLSAAALGAVGLPQRPVETVIAFSIAVVAREAWLAASGRTSLTVRAPWIAAFGFGLLHGFGFASALSEIGLPQDAKLAALLLFNAGVEIGQIAVVLVLAPALHLLRTHAAGARTRVERTASVALGALAAFWVIERALG
jgi:hypothetical protein